MLKNRNIPFGYCMVNGKYTLNAPEAEAVRKIFEEYINGKSLKAIASEMRIPYNSGKTVWNKNMVCRVIENAKYIGGGGFPKIISDEDFQCAAKIKTERNTYRQPTPKADFQPVQSTVYEYEPTEEIRRITNEINRLLDTENTDKSAVEELIIELAQQKYLAIKEVRT